MLVVQKYGGSSLADSGRILAAARQLRQLREAGDRVVCVVSAQGRTTDRMLSIAGEVAPRPDGQALDSYLCAGEQMAAGLLTLALKAGGTEAVCLNAWQAELRTDGAYGSGRITGVGPAIGRWLQKDAVVVVPGFQGISPEGMAVTLGRGGSDVTAVVLAAFLKADRCRICTDVDGVYDRDPRRFPDAVRLDRLTYGEMLDICDQGGRVLSRRSVELAREYGVELQVVSSFRPGRGTVVGLS